jgi:replicative DNA helicase
MNIFEADLLPMQVWAKRVEKKLDQWASGQPEGMSTGFKKLDPFMRLVDSEYTLIAARPSMGKTALGMQIATQIADKLKENGDRGVVAIFSAEMSGTELTIRMASGMSGVNAHALRNGFGSAAEVARYREALHKMAVSQIWIDDSTGPTTKTMLNRLSELTQTTPVRMMLFDFVELGGDEGRNEENRVSAIHRNLKGIAKTLDIPVIGLSQLNREVESRADKMPYLADLRASGMAEQIADKVVFIMRPEYYVERSMPVNAPEEDKKGVAYVSIAKNRTGPVSMVKMEFLKDKTQFRDADFERVEFNQ